MRLIKLINAMNNGVAKGRRVWLEPGVAHAIEGGRLYVAMHRLEDNSYQMAYTFEHINHSETSIVNASEVIALHPYVNVFVLFRAVEYSEIGRPCRVLCGFVMTNSLKLNRLKAARSLLTERYLSFFD